jgi:P27 family predicted phage terminase small subunit
MHYQDLRIPAQHPETADLANGIKRKKQGSGRPVPADILPPPYVVDDLAIQEWHRIAPILFAHNHLKATQRSLLAGYCNAVAKAVRAEEILVREGRYYEVETPTGSVVRRRHPASQDAEVGWGAVRQFARQLGLTVGGPIELEPSDERRAIFK